MRFVTVRADLFREVASILGLHKTQKIKKMRKEGKRLETLQTRLVDSLFRIPLFHFSNAWSNPPHHPNHTRAHRRITNFQGTII